MGRDNNYNNKTNQNNYKLPQTPNKTDNRDVELANELGDRYRLEIKPGFGPTGVERKK